MIYSDKWIFNLNALSEAHVLHSVQRSLSVSRGEENYQKVE